MVARRWFAPLLFVALSGSVWAYAQQRADDDAADRASRHDSDEWRAVAPHLPDPNTAIRDGKNLMCDVFATFVPCTRGLTPCFAAEDDYDATDAFSANRWLDSFAMQLVLRTDPTPPLTPVDPWKASGALAAAGSGLNAPTTATLQNLLLNATAGPAAAAVEYPPNFDATSVFLARLLIGATPGSAGQAPTWDLTKISIDNNSRLFLYPSALLGRLGGLGSGTEA